ncbi:C-type lectin domain family 12 member B-like [Platysternon megacephalum]|uniref:C-type lectin domain family 12 member B-like n=1 Tax=Platysternon megacephalum TaxID=55544 RepID=A0A4D9DTR4_9SAUR|nr:C-type lectin domain family 12 member B-like [Platysternon megacephalum]
MENVAAEACGGGGSVTIFGCWGPAVGGLGRRLQESEMAEELVHAAAKPQLCKGAECRGAITDGAGARRSSSQPALSRSYTPTPPHLGKSNTSSCCPVAALCCWGKRAGECPLAQESHSSTRVGRRLPHG